MPRALAILSCLLAAPVAAYADNGPRRLDLVFASDLDGRFTSRRCAGPPMDALGGTLGGLPPLAGAIGLAREQAPGALVIGGPGLLGSGHVARYLLDGGAGPARAARLMLSAGFEIIAPGTDEFTMPPAGLSAYLRAVRAGGATVLLSNLECAGAGCLPLVPEHILERNGVRVGLLAVVSADLRSRVGKGHIPGAVRPPESIAERVKRLRAAADVVVLITALDGNDYDPDSIGLSRALERLGAHVDLVLAGGYDDAGAAIAQVRLSSGTLLIGAPAYGGGVAVVRIELPAQLDGERARPAITQRRILGSVPHPGILAEVGRIHEDMCRAWGGRDGALPQGGLSAREMATVVLEALRAAGRSEIALINAGAIDPRGLPLISISRADLISVLPYPAQVISFRLTGKEIKEVLEQIVSAPAHPSQVTRRGRLHAMGLEKDGALKVNGRPLDPAARYSVTTIDFVAEGGDDLLRPEIIKGKKVEGRHGSLQEVVLAYLHARARDGAALARPLPLAERPLWQSSLDLGMDLTSVTVHNPQGGLYDRPLLQRRPSFTFKADASGRLQLDHPGHLLQLSLRTLYGLTYLAQAGEQEARLVETTDLITISALYNYRAFAVRARAAPTPFASLMLESEWTRPDERAYQHLELSSLLGLRSRLADKLSMVLGVGVRKELLARAFVPLEEDLARARFLFSVTIELLKRSLWAKLGDMLLGEFSLTYNHTDPVKLRSHELRTLGKIHVSLKRPLHLSAGADLYLYADRDRAPGVAVDVTAGLKVLLDARHQVF